MLTELIAANQRARRRTATATANGSGRAVEPPSSTRRTTTSTPASSTTTSDEPAFKGEDPGASRRYRFRHPTASGKTIAAAGFVESARHLGILILTHRRLLVSQFHARPDDRGLRRPLHRGDRQRQGAAPRRPDHDPDVRLVRPPRRRDLPQRVPARDLRRGPHGARREDERRDPLVQRAGLHRHDGDGAADREAGLRRLPGLGRRPPARGRRATRADRAASLPARAAGRRDQLRADRRRRLRGARARRSPRPLRAQPGGREPLPRAVRDDARHRLRGRRRARLQPRPGVPRRRASRPRRCRARRRP